MTETSGGTPHIDGVRVLDAGALRALAHPLRVQIYDILSQYGPQTASSLATMTGESSGSTSYHVRALAKQELIREVVGRGSGRERWWERPSGGVSIHNPEAMRTPSGRAASQVVMSEFFARRNAQLTAFLERGIAGDMDDWAKNAVISTSSARLTTAQLIELGTRLQDVIDEYVEAYRHQEGDVRPVTIRADIFPLPVEGH